MKTWEILLIVVCLWQVLSLKECPPLAKMIFAGGVGFILLVLGFISFKDKRNRKKLFKRI